MPTYNGRYIITVEITAKSAEEALELARKKLSVVEQMERYPLELYAFWDITDPHVSDK